LSTVREAVYNLAGLAGTVGASLLTECARRFSPLVEQIPPDAVLLDLRGLTTLWGLAQRVAEALSNQAGLPMDVAVATNPDCAHVDGVIHVRARRIVALAVSAGGIASQAMSIARQLVSA